VLHLCAEFEWDVTKATANKQKHGVTFEEAATVFADPHTLIASDALHVDRFNHSRPLFPRPHPRRRLRGEGS
jgi:hypothetical protein